MTRRWLPALLVAALVAFVALGAWQLQRLQWKRALIAGVEQRLGAPPIDAPGRAEWAGLDATHFQYTRVRLTGRYLASAVSTQAVTELGAGHWVLQPLQRQDGTVVYVNRGFVPLGAAPGKAPAGMVEVVGLLRAGEPGGGFLRRNDPARGRWFSRDPVALGALHGLPAAQVAPYFVDDAARGTGWPRGGMTVVRFRNNHLQYALTWFALAALSAFAFWRTRRG